MIRKSQFIVIKSSTQIIKNEHSKGCSDAIKEPFQGTVLSVKNITVIEITFFHDKKHFVEWKGSTDLEVSSMPMLRVYKTRSYV